MTQTPPTHLPSIIDDVLTRRNWSLSSEPILLVNATFLGRVQARLDEWCAAEPRPADEPLMRRAVIHEYCHLLHAAISQDGSRVQVIAMQETRDFGWPVVLREFTNDRKMAEPVLLRAVEKAWLGINKCQPGNYLAWFLKILRNEIKQEWRKIGKDPIIFSSDLERPEGDDEGDEEPLDQARSQICQEANSFADVERRELRQKLFDLLHTCLNNAHREFVILAQFFAAWSPSEIAKMLNERPTQVYMARSHALERLRTCCPDVIELLILQVS